MHRFYTYHIRIYDRSLVKAEVRNLDNELVAEPSGAFRYRYKKDRLIALQLAARLGQLSDEGVVELGNALFSVLFDSKLQHDFFHHHKTAKAQKSLLRIELEVDERRLPDVVALPWEFLRVPGFDGQAPWWVATDPNVIFLRRRALWDTPKPIQLEPGERLRIALAVAAPSELGQIRYKRIWTALTRLANSQPAKFDLLGLVSKATVNEIDALLERRPHLFHFIGHARVRNSHQQETGEIALVDNIPDKAIWVDSNDFGNLFNRHHPSVVILQSCEGGALSSSKAFVGVASQIVQQNIPVVVAMQYQISNSSAQTFVLEFYNRLAEGDPVDKAAQEGRRKIALGPVGYKARDFATPVLFMRVRDGELFQRILIHREALATTPIRLQVSSHREPPRIQAALPSEPQILSILETLRLEETPINSYVLEFIFPLYGPMMGPDGRCPLWWLAQNGLFSRLANLCQHIIEQVRKLQYAGEYGDVYFRSFLWSKLLLSFADCQRGFAKRALASLSDIHIFVATIGIPELIAWDLNIRAIISGRLGLEPEARALSQNAIFVAEESGLFWLAAVIRLRVLHRKDWHARERGDKPDDLSFENRLNEGLRDTNYVDSTSRLHLEALRSAVSVLHYSWSPENRDHTLSTAQNTISLLSSYPDHEEKARMISEAGRIKLYGFDDPNAAIEYLKQSAPLRLSSGNLSRLRYDLSWLAESYYKTGDVRNADLCARASLVLHNKLFSGANTDSGLVKRVKHSLSGSRVQDADILDESKRSTNSDILAESTNIHPAWWFNLLSSTKTE